jgi:hypothetical protein
MTVSDSTGARGAPKRLVRPLDIHMEVAVLQQMTVDQLRACYADAYGEPTQSRHKMHLVRKSAWGLQTLPPPTRRMCLSRPIPGCRASDGRSSGFRFFGLEGLDQEYNSLDAQRESVEAFIATQIADASPGWKSRPQIEHGYESVRSNRGRHG